MASLVTITNASISNSSTADVTLLTQNDNDLMNGVTDGTKAIYVAQAGIGITPTYLVDISGATSGRTVNLASTDTTATSYLIYGSKTGAATTNIGMYLTVSGATNNIAINTVAGSILHGNTSTLITVGGVVGTIQYLGTSDATTTFSFGRFSADSSSGAIRFVKSRHATIGSNTIVQDGDSVGTIIGYVADGTDFASDVGRIQFEVSGTPGANDTPGRITFYTTNDGSASGTEKMRLGDKGNLYIGGTVDGDGNKTKTLVLYSGTAPGSAAADSVVFYSSDISAGNTEPSFYCEGSSVLATGQADSASSVRVKMRINGTEVTLLAI